MFKRLFLNDPNKHSNKEPNIQKDITTINQEKNRN